MDRNVNKFKKEEIRKHDQKYCHLFVLIIQIEYDNHQNANANE